MTILSGKFGVVNGYSHIKNWSVDHNSSPEVHKTSATEFGQFVRPGVVDWSGSFDGAGEGPPVALWPGKTFTFTGYTAPNSNVYGQAGQVYSGSAIVDSLTLTWDWTPGGVHGWSLDFSAASGDITESAAFHDDTAVTIPDRMCSVNLETGAALSEAVWNDVTGATLTFTADNISYVNAGTNCTTSRRAGNIGWTLAVTEQSTEERFAIGSDTRFRLFTDAADFWLLEWGHLESIGNFSVDRESGAIIEKTYNFIMNGSTGSTLGSIAHPDGTTLWPETQTP